MLGGTMVHMNSIHRMPSLKGEIRFRALLLKLLFAGQVATFANTASAQPAAKEAPQPPTQLSEWSTQLMRQVQRECQEDTSASRASCFDVPIGGKVLDLVTVGEVSDAEKLRFWARWEAIIQPEHFPQNPGKVAWRKLLLTKVAWAPRNPETKTWGPPNADWICARWEEGGRSFVAIENSITIKRTGDDRIAYRHPERGESQDGSTFIIESQIDKPKLFDLLLTLFKVPWQSEKEFVVRWGMANRNPDSLKIRSARFHKELEPPHWREWFDEFSFDLSGDDPQYLTFGFLVSPKP